MRLILLPFSFVFGFAVYIKNFLYDKGIIKIFKVNKPVISIGNISTGGTGKTPIIEMLIDYLLQKKLSVAVISRGYKRKSKGSLLVSDGKKILTDYQNSGDETFQLAKKYPNVIIGVDEKRKRIAKKLNNNYKIDVFLLDDAFQHRKIFRDLDVLVIDGGKDPFYDFLLPAGNLRERVDAIKRSDVVMVTKTTENNFRNIKKHILEIKSLPVFKVDFDLHYFENIKGNLLNYENLNSKKIILFCGIGNPDFFVGQIIKSGAKIIKKYIYRDHYDYRINDLEKIFNEVDKNNIDYIITTEKDFVKIIDKLSLFSNEVKEKVFYGKLEKSLQDKLEFFKVIDNVIYK